MNKLVTVKNRKTGETERLPLRWSFGAMMPEAMVEDFCFVPKKLYKRQQRDLNRIRSKRKPNPFGSKLAERLAKQYGTKTGFAKKKVK